MGEGIATFCCGLVCFLPGSLLQFFGFFSTKWVKIESYDPTLECYRGIVSKSDDCPYSLKGRVLNSRIAN